MIRRRSVGTALVADLPPPPGRRDWPWTLDSADRVDPSLASPPQGSDLPSITIVVPSFQQARYLEETIRSVLLQGYPGTELIVSDGGSEDGTLEILERYDEHLIWWSESDRGQSHAINKGLARASGDLVTFIGSDDVYLPGAFLDAGRRFAERPEVGAVAGAFRFFDAESRPIGDPIPARLPPGPEAGPVDLSLADPGSWRVHQVSTFYSRSALLAVGPAVCEDLRYTMDRELLYRVCREFALLISPVTYAFFRRHPSSKSASVEDMLPFCLELSTLPLRLSRPGESRAVERRRRAVARHWLAKADLKASRHTRGPAAALALLRSLGRRPSQALKLSYYAHWIDALGLRGARERFRRRSLLPPASAGGIWRHFAALEGATVDGMVGIASAHAIGGLIRVIRRRRPLRILEIGSGIGTLTYTVLVTARRLGLTREPGFVFETVETEPFCVQQLQRNLQPFAGEFSVSDGTSLGVLAGAGGFDLMVIDGGGDLPNDMGVIELGELLAERGMIFVEGSRDFQRRLIADRYGDRRYCYRASSAWRKRLQVPDQDLQAANKSFHLFVFEPSRWERLLCVLKAQFNRISRGFRDRCVRWAARLGRRQQRGVS